MPEADPLASIGYLLAAAAITTVSIAAYAIGLARRLAEARALAASISSDHLRPRPVKKRPPNVVH